MRSIWTVRILIDIRSDTVNEWSRLKAKGLYIAKIRNSDRARTSTQGLGAQGLFSPPTSRNATTNLENAGRTGKFVGGPVFFEGQFLLGVALEH